MIERSQQEKVKDEKEKVGEDKYENGKDIKRSSSDKDTIRHLRRTEERFAKLGGGIWFVVLATEDVYVGGLRRVDKMTGNKGRLDKLCDRIPCDAIIFTEINDIGLSKPFHLDQVTEFYQKLGEMFGIFDATGFAIVQIDSGAQAPRRSFSEFLDDLPI